MKKSLILILLFSLFFSCKTKNAENEKNNTTEKETVKTEIKAKDKTTTINWMSFEEALAAQKANPKKIMMDAYTNWCGPCKMLDKNTFHNADVAKYVNDNYYAVKFNAEGNETITFRDRTYTNPGYDASKPNKRNASHQLSQYFRIQAYPTILFLDEKAEVITPLKGYYKPTQLEIYLKLFATDDFLTVKSAEEWQAYQDKFVSTFKED